MSTQAERWATLPDEMRRTTQVSIPVSALAVGERRLEAKAYLAGGYGLRAQIEATAAFARVGDLAKVWQPGRLKGIVVGEDDGLPFLAASQLFDLRPTPRKWIAPSKTPDLDARFVEPGWILVTASGSVGDPMVTFGPHLKTVISHDLLRIQVHDARDRGYLYAFFRSAIGHALLLSSEYGSNIKHLEVEHVVTVPVPTISPSLRDELDRRITRVFALREQAYELTREAERLYTEHFQDIEVPSGTEGYEIHASQMFGGRRRLDADFYNRDAADVERILRTEPVEPLGDLVEDIILPNRFTRVFVSGDNGLPYVRSEQIFKVNPPITKRVVHAERKSLDDYLIRAGSLLVARSGQTYGLFGSTVLANPRHQGAVVSEDIIRVVPKEPGSGHARPGYLTLALGHPTLGRPLVVRLAFGATIPHLAPKDLAAVPIPRLGALLEDDLADRMEEATMIRMKADEEEDAAVALLDASSPGETIADVHTLSPENRPRDFSQRALDMVRQVTADHDE